MALRSILLVRHAEALKNVEDRHGGTGTQLTAVGRAQCIRISEWILENYGQVYDGVVIGHNVPQVQETVEIMNRDLRLPTLWDERLRGNYIGKAAGLSRIEFSRQYPEAAARFELWRNGQLRVDHLRLPDQEPVDDFSHRIREMFQEWLSRQNDLIVAVASTSTLIMLCNLVNLWGRFNYEDYRVMSFSNASISIVQVGTDGTPRLSSVNGVDHL